MARWVYAFADDIGERDARELLGGKGAGLAEMTRLAVPVPPGFTITTDACCEYQRTGQLPQGLDRQVRTGLDELEASIGRRLGDASDPLLVSVRSGARASMPGMMDTILNLGLNPTTVEGLARVSGDRRFAFDAYRRLLEMYGSVVLGVDRDRFERLLTDLKRSLGDPAMPDTDVGADALQSLCTSAAGLVEAFPMDVEQQLWGAIRAVFDSWNNPRAVRYRRMHEYSDDWGTAVNVQAMVFGNKGDDSGSGVAFTRNPSTGEKRLYGEFLPNAQGEDVVAGIRTPRPLTEYSAAPGKEHLSLQASMPDAFGQIVEIADRLEAHYSDVQDIEFTVEKGRTFILQTRSGKRTAHAAVKIAVDMVSEGLLTRPQALLKVEAESLTQLLHARLPDPAVLSERGHEPLATGLPASPGAASGIVVFDADEAETLAADGVDVILVRRETSPEDIHGMKAARGIVTATGGMTSHAAVVARGLGKCCVAGVSALNVDYEAGFATVRASGKAHRISKRDVLTLDGTHGALYAGELEVEPAAEVAEFETLMSWADAERRMVVRANADTPRTARTARSYGAEGIGLCRTEHMFFAPERLSAVRCMVLADDDDVRKGWLAKLLPVQRQDFSQIFEAMAGLPVTIRLLDWPLHEFLPREPDEFEAVARALNVETNLVRARATALAEVNPMLGHRGVRLGLTRPAIYAMQVQALVEAAVASRAAGHTVKPEIMVPVVGLGEELARMVALIRQTIATTLERLHAQLEFAVGTMIELPRACLVADQLARHAEFFSFGTNDLTQTTLGVSRDDSGPFISAYRDLGVLSADPFATIDVDGVGELVRVAVEKGRQGRAAIKLGVCGEHGGDPRSIQFCEGLGLDYISCSAPRLPIARLAAAQARIRERQCT